jgi:hypothetical protein
MKEELEQKLVEKYPLILKDYRGDCQKTCMAFGIECSDGWYDMLDLAMEKIQYVCDMSKRDGRNIQLVADQIKEKFGTLRFYYTVDGIYEDTDIVAERILSDIVSQTENISSSICEDCGDRRTARLSSKGGWMRTVCEKCAEKAGYVAKDE